MNQHTQMSFDGFGINGKDEYRTRVATFGQTVPEWERAQLARLWIAAPDLLEALRDACLTYAVHGDQPPDKWLAAIAKAEGRG